MATDRSITGAPPSQAVDKLIRSDGELSPRRKTRLPSQLSFPLVVVLSLTITSLGYSVLNDRTRGELAAIARPLSNSEVGLLIGWRIVELSLGWWANYDSVDLAALSLLSHGPTVYLLSTFYGIRSGTAAAALFIDVLSSLIPYQLLRPLSSVHARSPSTPNREIVSDPTILAYNGVLVALIYSVTLFVSLKTVLPGSFVLYFTSMRSIQPANDATLLYPPAWLLSILFGIATPLFVFTPAAAVDRATPVPDFDPVEATLAETVRWNLFGYAAPVKVGAGRTTVLVAVTWISTYLQLATTVYGIERAGAATYASVWATAALLSGVGLQFVGSA